MQQSQIRLTCVFKRHHTELTESNKMQVSVAFGDPYCTHYRHWFIA